MTAVSKAGLVLSGGRRAPMPTTGHAYGMWMGRIRTIKEIVFAGQTTGVHTNGAQYTYDGAQFTAYRTDANGSSEITASGLRIARTASSVTPNAHGIYLPGDASVGGWLYQNVGMERFHRGNWQVWLYFQNISIASMTATFTGFEISGGYPYHGGSARRQKTGGSTPASQGGNSANIYGPTTETNVTMTSSDTGYQYDTLCIHNINPWHRNVYAGQYSSGWPSLSSMVHVGFMNHMSSSHHVTRNGTSATTFMRDFKLWQLYIFLGGTNVGEVTVERVRVTEFC